MSHGPFKQRGRVLIENGYTIIPIEPGTKGPRREGWQEDYANDERSYKRMLGELNSPDSGIGIITEFTPAIDIDCTNATVTHHMVKWCHKNIGRAPLRIGKAPKALLVYNVDEPFMRVASASYMDPENPEYDKKGKKKGQRVEVLGKGQQFVAYHIHPDTGKPYTWPEDWEDPENIPVSDLPVLTLDQAQDACREFERKCESLGWEKVGEGSYARELGDDDDDAMADLDPPEETGAEVERLKSALEVIKTVISEYDYDQWRNLIFGIKWTKWDCAEELARDASEASEWHVTKTFNTVWRGAQKRNRGREVTLATVFKMAKDAGWDAKRAPSEEDKKKARETIQEKIDGLEFENDTQTAVNKIIEAMAEMDLSAVAEDEFLKAIRKQTGYSVVQMRRDLTRARKAHVKEVDHLATHDGYAKKLIESLQDKSGVKPVGVEQLIYCFNDKTGTWKGTIPQDFAVKVATMFDGMDNCSRRNDYIAIAQQAYSIIADGKEDFFQKAPIGLACTGRFYKVNEKGEIEREELNHSHRQRVISEVKPVVGEMPLFERFLDDAFRGDDNSQQRDLLQEVMGSIMLGLTARYEKVILLKGPGRSGKGTIMKIIEALLPREYRTAVSPFKWDNEYYLANLSGKRLNLVGELPDDTPIPAAQFKTVVGRDTLTGRHPTGRPFDFRNEAAHIFNTNHFVYTKDHTEAFFSRWILMEFRNSRIGREDEQITDLAQQIIEKESSAIMAWALKGAKRLQDRGYFPVTDVHRKLMTQWRHRTNTLMEFMLDGEYCVLGNPKTYYVPRSDLYREYAAWCKDSNRRPLGKIKFYDAIEDTCIAELGIRKGTDAGGRDVIRGVRLFDDGWDPVEDEDDEL